MQLGNGGGGERQLGKGAGRGSWVRGRERQLG